MSSTVENNLEPVARPHWLRVVLIGRRPKATLQRVVVLAAVCFVTFKFILLPVRVDGISMEPTYHNNAINGVYRLAYKFHEPRRGDIVGVRFSDPGAFAAPSQMLMKRIIALPGETISFHNGVAFIDGHRLSEPYLKYSCDWEDGPFTCGPNQFYIVGDNRSMAVSQHTHGRVERERIVGKILL